MQVLMTPDYRADNPYQSLLSNALNEEEVNVCFPRGYRRILPIFRAIQANPQKINILHLHWIDPYLKGKHILVKFIYCIKFLIDIALVRIFGVKIVWTVHNLISHGSQIPRLELWLQRVLTRLVSNCIVHNTVHADIICQSYRLSPTKVTVIPHGHYRDIYPSIIDLKLARKHLDIYDEKKIYLNLGMLKPYKGLETLITVWKQEITDKKNSLLLIAGQALDIDYGDLLAKMSMEEESIILKQQFIKNEELPYFFSAANIMVLPFKSILTSGSLILAMSFGKPIIAPRLAGITETLAGADDLLYDPDENEGLSNAILKSQTINLFDLSSRTTKACDRLDWKDIAVKTKQVYAT
jgi:glycosyltransferase involved in cell wall biosynthesis